MKPENGWNKTIQSHPQNTKSKYSDLVKEIVHHFNLVSHELRKIYGEASNVAPKSIFGVELLDVALRDASMPAKEAGVSTPWAHLPKHEPCIVLFCKKLGQPIVSSSTVELCSNRHTIPPRKRYLVASGASIIHLLRRHTRGGTSSLADEIYWLFQPPFTERHQRGKQHKARHHQLLKHSAFVFGNSSKVKKYCKQM